MAQQPPGIGSDVTSLMPPVGADVSRLMSGSPAAPAATAEPSIWDKLAAINKAVEPYGRAFQDLNVGALKGAGSTAIGMGELVAKIPGFAEGVNALYEKIGMRGVDTKAALEAVQTELEPTSTAQRIGKFAEQTGEFMLPVGASERAAAGVAAKIAPAFRNAPRFVQAAAKVAPRMATDAATIGGVTAAQGGNPLVGAAIGAAGPLIGAAMPEVSALRAAAEKKVVQAISGPAKERFKAMAARLAPQMLKRGLGGSRESLQAQAAEAASVAGEQIDAAIQQFGSRQADTKPVLAALEQAKDAFRVMRTVQLAPVEAGGPARVSQIPVIIEPRALNQLSKLQEVVSNLGPEATVAQLVAIRRAWDTVVDQAGGYAHRAGGAIGVPLKDVTEAWAKREGAGAIRKLLAADVPELTAINKEFAFWKSLDDVLTQTLQRTQSHGPGLLRTGAEIGGQVVGGLAGSPAGTAGTIGGALVLGKVAKMAHAVLASPRWRLVDAKLRNALADAIASGEVSRMTTAFGRIGASISSTATQR